MLIVGVVALIGVRYGCGPDDGLTLARVRGKVTFKGEPLRLGSVMFQPDDPKRTGGPTSLGPIRDDGSFTLSTERAGDGAQVGLHLVAFAGYKPRAEGAAPVPAATKQKANLPDRSGMRKSLIPERLKDPRTSNVKVEVKPGSNTIDFDIREDGSVVVGP